MKRSNGFVSWELKQRHTSRPSVKVTKSPVRGTAVITAQLSWILLQALQVVGNTQRQK